jgi:preprotein translocase subunit SecF
MSRLGNIGGRLYRGDVSVEFVGRKKIWFAVSGLILVISIAALAINGLNFSVDFKGGSVFQFQASGVTTTQIASVVSNAGGGDDPIVQHLVQIGGGNVSKWQVQTTRLSYNTTVKIQNALASNFHVAGGAGRVDTTFVGPSWGSQISDKAFQALIAFLIVIVIYLSIAFEWRMAVAAFVALAHDILITTGVYALAHFVVSPATVIGLLTILGYSLYDTVVVFDKVRENTAGLIGTNKSTYSQAANLALNQTLVRSINTSLIALLPVTAILIAGYFIIGTGELPDLGLVLFVGMLSGTYSSIFIATPVLALLKEHQRQYRELARRVALRASGGRAAQRARAKAEKAQKAGAVAGRTADSAAPASLDSAEEGTDGDSGVAGGRLGTATASGASPAAGARPPGPADEDEDLDETADDGGGLPDTGPAERVPAGRAAGGGSVPRGASGARPGPRQQPRRAGSAKRRPAGKKKRR